MVRRVGIAGGQSGAQRRGRSLQLRSRREARQRLGPVPLAAVMTAQRVTLESRRKRQCQPTDGADRRSISRIADANPVRSAAVVRELTHTKRD